MDMTERSDLLQGLYREQGHLHSLAYQARELGAVAIADRIQSSLDSVNMALSEMTGQDEEKPGSLNLTRL
jgi:hypothetical protein